MRERGEKKGGKREKELKRRARDRNREETRQKMGEIEIG